MKQKNKVMSSSMNDDHPADLKEMVLKLFEALDETDPLLKEKILTLLEARAHSDSDLHPSAS